MLKSTTNNFATVNTSLLHEIISKDETIKTVVFGKKLVN